MKRLFTFLALVLGLVSCQTEGFDVNVGGEQDVNITVSLPEGTRADSALGAFDNVKFENYDVRFQCEVHYNGQVKVLPVQISDNGKEATFPVRLIANRDYTFVVWADLVNEGSEEDLHYNTSAGLHNITINDWNAMDETRDAFTCSVTRRFERGNAITLELKRPFAKLRVITTDMKELMGIVPAKAEVEYTTKYRNSFNAVEAKAGDVYDTKTHNLFEIASYGETGTDKTLFTDYLFASEGDIVNFYMNVYDQNGDPIDEQKNFNTPIPVKRNYVTTIKGNILTYADDFTVEIKDAFDNAGNLEDIPYHYATVTNGADLLKAIAEGREIIALNHIIVTAADANFEEGTTRSTTAINPVLNLNGFTVTFVNDTDEPLITVAEGSSLTIVDEKGTGAIVVKGTGVAIENNGTINIEGGSVVSNDNGTVIVNNGEANIEDATLNEGAVENNGTTNVNGGEVADGAIENTEDAIVGTYVYTAEELEAAINACVAGLNNEVSFGADIVGDVTAIQKQAVKITINGRGFKYDGSIKIHSNSEHYADAALTIKNVNFETATASVNFVEALENGSQRYSTNITVKDCTFTATGEAVDTAVGVQIKTSKNAKVLNCTATGMHSLIQAQSCDETVVVEGCTINGKNGVAFKQVKAATVEGTTIVAKEYGIRFDGNTDNYGIVVKNNNVTAYQPLIVRKMTGKNNTIALEGENTLTTEEAYKIVITNGSDDEAYVAPTGTYTLTGADAFVVYPRDVVSSWNEFTAALAANKTFVLLANDITYDKSYTITKDITVDLNGKTFAIDNVSAMLNIGDSKNSSKPNVTIKNGNFNTIIYALSGNVTIQDVVFGGTISYVSASQGVVSTKHANLLMDNCKMTNVKKSGSTKPRSLCTEGRSSGYLIFRNCNFKNSNLERPYINPLNGTATLELTNCSLYSGATNIDLGASLVWSNTNLNLNGCSGGFTFTISRASTSLTEDELAVYRAIKQNNSGSKRFLFTDGEKNNL
ncbi:MAG: hypothetical protein J6U93_05455 [Alistipes sp.]|nr:hypothetical protein [Alistipes sp.]